MRKHRHHRHGGFLTIILAALLLTAGIWHFVELSKAATVHVTAHVAGCGNGVVESGEDCDGADLNSNTCTVAGFIGGSISCLPNCTLNTSACSASSGGGTPPPTVSTTSEIFTGYTGPENTVTIFKDGLPITTVVADITGNYYAKIDNLNNGSYIFGFQAMEPDGDLSAISTIAVTANGGTVTNANIFLSPTMDPMTSPTIPGQSVMMMGQTYPNSMVTVSLFSPIGTEISRTVVQAGLDGNYSTTFASNLLTVAGIYTNIDQARSDIHTSELSLPAFFSVGVSPVIFGPGNFNEDQKVSLVDFSIALFWYKYPLSDAFKLLESRHGNGDGKIDLIDISIVCYWWTG